MGHETSFTVKVPFVCPVENRLKKGQEQKLEVSEGYCSKPKVSGARGRAIEVVWNGQYLKVF